ncbi:MULTISPECIES: hypothetical protein [Xanthomonas]|uniref:Relaxation protein n=1 Tax=Xanthomonas cucurbitae TaxID=56453 RepID=A0A2S7DN87_9XANT|nr:hypothetical protein [Xanthomonas cucurbitae]PPU75272.1 hypothetical protein XcuCFBP2542_15050 [Xanthomonas cucurbitae]QHG87608.1 hypothetical protein EBN15_12325 [Xanthomonas cucurbitae]WDM66466.1 hypothetical protein K6981_13020 [Xanthomonas cucurbitae]WDM70345.1 hypothetical protein K6978_12990 [Xanthomonas cucurbitae]WDM74219.1 hypothetical protein K6982_12350 [Xanthomonas cucurbitae]
MKSQNVPELLQANAILGASRQQLQEAVKAMAILLATMRQRDERLQELVQQQMQTLQYAIDDADQRIDQVVESALPQLVQASQQGLDPALDQFDKTLAEAETSLQQTTQRFLQAQRSFETAAARRLWLASTAMLVAGAIGIAMAGYVVYTAMSLATETAHDRAEFVVPERVERTELVPCGNDRPCAAGEANAALQEQKGE